MPDEDEVAEDESQDAFWNRQVNTAYETGVKVGREQAWNEALAIVKNQAAAAYISGGDSREAQRLREVAQQMLTAMH